MKKKKDKSCYFRQCRNIRSQYHLVGQLGTAAQWGTDFYIEEEDEDEDEDNDDDYSCQSTLKLSHTLLKYN